MDRFILSVLAGIKGVSWPEVVALAILCATAAFLGWLRLQHGERERKFWANVTPEQAMARAATAATLPPPTPPPPSPVPPALLAILIAASLLLTGCHLTMGQLQNLQAWQRAARAACKTPGQCPGSRACIAAVVEATESAARDPRKLYAAAAVGPCQPYLLRAVP